MVTRPRKARLFSAVDTVCLLEDGDMGNSGFKLHYSYYALHTGSAPLLHFPWNVINFFSQDDTGMNEPWCANVHPIEKTNKSIDWPGNRVMQDFTASNTGCVNFMGLQ